MKNLIRFTLNASFVIAISFTMFSCSSSSCEVNERNADIDRIDELADIYIADISNDEKCQDFVNAVRQFVSDYKDCDEVTQADLDDFESAIESLPCA